MMYKVINIDPYFNETDELSVSLIDLKSFTKTAALLCTHIPEEIVSFVKGIIPDPKYVYAHVIAVSADEYYGSNRNGDAFPEKDLLGEQDELEASKNPVPYTGTKLQRYKTFLSAKFFKHHLNKEDSPSYGSVVCAAYNTKMHRVELIIKVEVEKDPDFVSDLLAGKAIALSMGCFTENTNITLCDGTEKLIKDIVIGDRVINCVGKPTRVNEVSKRQYCGRINTIKATSTKPISATEEHPFLIVRKDSLVSREKPCSDKLVWIHAKCIVDGDYLAKPIINEEITPDYISYSVAKFLGYYLAEGHLLKNKKKEVVGIEFTANINDQINKDITKICEEIGTKNAPVFRLRANTKQAVSIQIYDYKIAELCQVLCGSYAKFKRLDESVMLWDIETQKYFIGSYIDGDGCFNSGKWQPGSVTISTASQYLNKQIPCILARLGIVTSQQALKHHTGFSETETTEYQIYIGKSYSGFLVGYSNKITNGSKDSLSNFRQEQFSDGKYVYSRVKSNISELKECDVFNFEVEEEESYLAEGVCVHNCKVPFDICIICGNKAKSRAEYCDHAKNMMGRILDDGRQVKVLNTKERFFDISRVCVNADEQAWVLKKVASILGVSEFDPREYYEDEDMETLATAFKNAEIDKKVTGQTIGDAVKNVNSKLMTEISQKEPDIAPSDLDEAAERPYGDILSTLTNMGMVLKPAEHRRIVIIKISRNPDFLKESSAIDVDFQDRKVYNIFKKYAETRSCYTDYLVKRAALSNRSEDLVVDTDPISDSLYNVYRNELLRLDAEKVAKAIDRNYNIGSLFKTAVHWALPTAAVPLSAAYMYGAHQDYKRRYQGKPLSSFQEYMAEKPGQVGAGAALAALLARGLLKGKTIKIEPKT